MSLHVDAALDARGVAVALTVADGETLALLGPNGAGKSTVLGMLAGLVRPDRGRARLGDDVLFDLPGAWRPPHRRGVALLAQDALLFPHLSVARNVAFGPRAGGATHAEAAQRATSGCAAPAPPPSPIAAPPSSPAVRRSGVAIARALAAEPSLLLLDEPLSALDVAVAAEVRGMLGEVLAGRTTVLVTHDALDAYLLADRVAIMHDGRVVEEGPTRAVLERPRHPFTAELSGLTLLSGVRTPDGLQTGDGMRVRGDAVASVPVGSPALAAVRPSAVRLGEARDAALTATVTALEPQADLVRVRTDRLDALVPPADVADLRLRVGDRVGLDVPAAAVSVYPA